jgi:hypothetical protein
MIVSPHSFFCAHVGKVASTSSFTTNLNEMLALLVQFHSLSSPHQWAGTISFDESSLRTGPATSSNPPGLWPAPAQYTAAPSAGKGAIAIINPAALVLQCSGGGCSAAVVPAFARGKAWALDAPHPNTTGATLKRIVVRVKSATAVPLQLGADESYSLAVNTTHAVIEAPTQFGAMHGLETLFQLVVIKNTWASCALYCGAYALRVDVPFTIIDAPRVSFLLFTVTFYANHAHNLTRSP